MHQYIVKIAISPVKNRKSQLLLISAVICSNNLDNFMLNSVGFQVCI